MSIAYTDKSIEGKVKISPSGFATFFENPQAWYRNQILKDSNFRGNTNTVVGTIIHKRIENYFNDVPTNPKEEQDYIQQYRDVVEVDEWKVADELERLWNVLQLDLPTLEKPTSQEQQVEFHIPNSNYFIFGTYDYMRGTTIGDIKTTSVTPKKIKVAHRIQLLLYALALKHNGVEVTDMEIMYVVKLKSKPKVIVLKEDIKEIDMDYIKKEVKDMVTRCEMVRENNELQDILFPNNPDSYIN